MLDHYKRYFKEAFTKNDLFEFLMDLNTKELEEIIDNIKKMNPKVRKANLYPKFNDDDDSFEINTTLREIIQDEAKKDKKVLDIINKMYPDETEEEKEQEKKWQIKRNKE